MASERVSDNGLSGNRVANERGLPTVTQLKNYRQALRDMDTQIDADPDNITWPTK